MTADAPVVTTREINLYNATTEQAREWAEIMADFNTPESQATLLEALPVLAAEVGQMWIGGVEPMGFEEFAFLLDGEQLRPRQLALFRDVGLDVARAFFDPAREVIEIVALWGKGSGKGYIGAKFISYIAYIVLHLKNPWTTLHLAQNTALSVMNVAPSEDLAKEVFFNYLARFIQSPPFVPYLTDPKHQIYSDKIVFPQANLTMFSKHSRAAGLDGYNLLAWNMDEADEFLDTQKVSNGDVIHNIFRSSCSTRMQRFWLGLVTSYPRTAEGFMMRLYERAKTDATYHADKAATWDVRPEISRELPSIASDYRNDPRDAAARYECLSGNTWVVDDGGLVRLSDAANRLHKGKQQSYRLITKYGYEIEATADHLMLLPDGSWKTISEFGKGDSIAACQREQSFGTNRVDVRLAELAGLLVGDGWIGIDHNQWGTPAPVVGWRYDPKDRDVAQRHNRMLCDLGFKPASSLGGRAWRMRLRTGQAYETFQNLIGDPEKSWNKRVPVWLFRSDKPTIAAFLSGIFEAEGSINAHGTVCYGSSSQGLVQDLQLLLGLFGITGQIHIHKPRFIPSWGNQSKQFWTLQLSPKRGFAFWKQIGFLSVRKRMRADTIFSAKPEGWEVLPDVYTDKVVSVEHIGEQDVYDLLDRPEHRFYANGLIAHNCEPMQAEDAFFELVEKIDQAIDPTRLPIASVTFTVTYRPRTRDNHVSEYVCAVLHNLEAEPGHSYFVSCDGGLTGDSFAISVMHTDGTDEAPDWLCPSCGSAPELRQFSRYERQLHNAFNDEVVRCGYCYQTPRTITPLSGRQGWYRKLLSGKGQSVTVKGKEFSIPHIYEDLLIDIQPTKVMRKGDVAQPVDFPGTESVVKTLIQTLTPTLVRLDPWQAAQMIQGLQDTGADVDKESFSQPDQYMRARCVKTLLYNDLLTFLPGPLDRNGIGDKASREMKQLQRKGMKIDHPLPHGSKDLYDARAINIWNAATWGNEELRLMFSMD